MHISSGPRRRRFLYELLTSSDEGQALSEAVWRSRRHSAALEISRLIGTVDLTLSRADAHQALADAVALAMYWQEPDEIDRTLADEEVRSALAAVDDRQVLEALDCGDDELAVRWITDHAQPSDGLPAEQMLSQWLDDLVRSVRRSEQERPDDPAAAWSGRWWSMPPNNLLSSSGTTVTGVPAGLEYVEDGPPSDHAEVLRLALDKPAVFVIDSEEDWADLCDTYPLDVTAEVRQDWYRTTGRAGPWIIPNWRDVGRDWDGVKLTVAGYLTLAGTLIPTRQGASVIAGWNPGHTYWLTDVEILDRQRWKRRSDGMTWYPE
ncbi:hypothetical protein [Flaviflexus huanghaiensis]|uniref:hypothetical protein n=1 Tax=Flaviflexus huanghaiensis TaxID=1111473 RepID=UPI0015FC5A04|nr:hypothetical protein [Flaviflexus huanghaiensis]